MDDTAECAQLCTNSALHNAGVHHCFAVCVAMRDSMYNRLIPLYSFECDGKPIDAADVCNELSGAQVVQALRGYCVRQEHKIFKAYPSNQDGIGAHDKMLGHMHEWFEYAASLAAQVSVPEK